MGMRRENDLGKQGSLIQFIYLALEHPVVPQLTMWSIRLGEPFKVAGKTGGTGVKSESVYLTFEAERETRIVEAYTSTTHVRDT